MGELFWSLEDEDGDAASSGPYAMSAPSSPSPQRAEHIIHGSPLWLMAGIALFGSMMVWSPDWGVWLTLAAIGLPLYGVFEYMKTVVVSWDQEQRHVEVHEGPRYSEERWLMLAYTSEPGDQVIIESEPTSGNSLDVFGARDHWLVVKRKDGTFVASSKDTENSRYFAKRIKDCLDLLG